MKNKMFRWLNVALIAILMSTFIFPMNALASNNADFSHLGGAVEETFGAGTQDIVVLHVKIPDGANGSGEDTLIIDGGETVWSGEPLVAMTSDEYFLDADYDGFWFDNPDPEETKEAFWSDNGNTAIESGEILVEGFADLESFRASGPGTEYVIDDTATDQGPGLLSADYDGLPNREAVWSDNDGNNLLGPGDTMLQPGRAGLINFDSSTLNPGGVCGLSGVGGCNGEAQVDDIMWCDGPGGGGPDTLFTIGESIYMDKVGLTPDLFNFGFDIIMIDPSGVLTPAPTPCVAAGGNSTFVN